MTTFTVSTRSDLRFSSLHGTPWIMPACSFVLAFVQRPVLLLATVRPRHHFIMEERTMLKSLTPAVVTATAIMFRPLESSQYHPNVGNWPRLCCRRHTGNKTTIGSITATIQKMRQDCARHSPKHTKRGWLWRLLAATCKIWDGFCIAAAPPSVSAHQRTAWTTTRSTPASNN